MPPVRWKLGAAAQLAAVLAIVVVSLCRAQPSSKLHDSISMMENGWRPIAGIQREPVAYNDEITQYRNPASKKSETIRVDKIAPKSSGSESTTTTKSTVVINTLSPLGSKIPPHSKPMILVPAGSHGTQIPISPLARHPGPYKFGHIMKMHHAGGGGGKRHNKPIRVQIPAYSTRDEVYVPAPSSNLGPYTFYTAAAAPGGNQNTLKLRNQPPHYIEFSNHFPIPNTQDELFQIVRAPVQQYVIPKNPLHNDVHYTFQQNDDYNTRNNGPPPPPYKLEKQPSKSKITKDDQHNTKPQHLSLQSMPPPPPPPFHLASPPPKPVEVEITKEKLKTFHPPKIVVPFEEIEFHPFKQPPTYEVTEGKWLETSPPHFHYHFSMKPPPPSHKNKPLLLQPQRGPFSSHIEIESKPFLPTPVRPDSAPPTIATESEASTIYNQIYKINKQKEQVTKPPPLYFDIKEVSTHFPIIGKPEVQDYPTKISLTDYDVTTTTKSSNLLADDDTITTMRVATTTLRPQRKRVNHRRRRPSTTTTEESGIATEMIYDYVPKTTEPPSSGEDAGTTSSNRIRRPAHRFKTTSGSSSTTQPPPEDETIRHRIRRPKPSKTTTTEETKIIEAFSNHKVENALPTVESFSDGDKFVSKPSTERDFPASFEKHFASLFQKTSSQENTDEYDLPIKHYMKNYDGGQDSFNRYYTNPPKRGDNTNNNNDGDGDDDDDDQEDDSTTATPHTSAPKKVVYYSATTVNTPENEVDYTTRPYINQPSHSPITLRDEILESTTTSTTTTTTTTTPEPSTKSFRVRTRPPNNNNKYDTSNRPRFSVKDYRQRLTTSSTTTTTESTKTSAYNSDMRMRYPNRSRRPITTIGHSDPPADEESTEPINRGSKFTPKEPRHPSSSDSNSTTGGGQFKNRIRPFGRYKPTTEPSTTTARVSIKPNIFGNLRRPTPISLKNRILSKQKNTATTTSSSTPETTDSEEDETNETDMSEIIESTIPYSSVDSTTEFGAKKITESDAAANKRDDVVDVKTASSDDILQSSIVSDLTSSAKNEYNKPGLFKNVNPTSRKVPSYFTLATEDPILPIEAFFPNLKDKQ